MLSHVKFTVFVLILFIANSCFPKFIIPNDLLLQQKTGKGEQELNDLIAQIQDAEKVVPSEWGLYYPITCELINNLNLQVGVEIGVAFGTHSEFILKNTSIKKLYSIDPFLEYWELSHLKKAHWDLIFLNVEKLLEPFGERSTLLRLTSVKAAPLVPDNLDFVFIDGDHAYQAVKQDLDLWFNKLRSGGILIGDDYQQTWGVKPAVDELCSAKNLKLHIIPVDGISYDRYWYIQK